MLVVRHVAKAVLGPREADEALGLQLLQQVLADGAVHHLARMVVIAKQERDVDDLHLGNEVAERPGRGVDDVLRAELHRLDHFPLATQSAGRKLLDLVATAGALAHLVGEHGGAHPVMRLFGGGIAQLERALRANIERAGEACREGKQRKHRLRQEHVLLAIE